MRAISYNIYKSAISREHLIAELIEIYNADLIVLQEAAVAGTARRIAQILDYPFYASHEGYSTGFISRIPVDFVWHTGHFLRSPLLQLNLKEMNLSIFGVHLYSTLANWMERVRLREIQSVLEIMRQHGQRPHLIMGDFNTIAPDDTFDTKTMPRYLRWMIRANGGDVSRRALSTLRDAGYIDTFRHLHPTKNGWSMPSSHSNTRLDYAWATPASFAYIHDCITIDAPASLIAQASDHRPLLITLHGASASP